MTHSPDRLTPEERDLASRLARIGPHGEPPAALDAHILSAAHAAVATSPARHRRWPAVLGVAATLALAIGVTWQLRPRPDASPALQEGPVAAEAPAPAAEAMSEATDATAAAPPADATGAVGADQSAVSKATASAPDMEEAVAKPSRANAPADASGNASAPSQVRRAPLRTMALPPEEPPTIIATQEADAAAESPSFAPAPAPMAAPASAAAKIAPPPPPPAPPAPRTVATPAAATVTVTGSARTAQRAARPPPVTADSNALEALPRIGSRAARDVPIDEDARLGTSDWLDRIRLRRAADDLAGARASLALFRRYHPDHPIPEDLAPLVQ